MKSKNRSFSFSSSLNFVVFFAALTPQFLWASIAPSLRHEAGNNKSGQYISDGFFVGGERSVTSAKLVDVRRAKSGEGFERIVLDLKANEEQGKGLPYFQVQASPNEGRYIVSIWADVVYDFDSAKIRKAFAKSSNVKKLNVVPRVEEGLTILEFVLGSKKTKLEVFKLANPSRIIMDIL